jgi:hypothetical protein
MLKQKISPQLAEMKRCAGRAKTKLFQVKKAELKTYYLQECAKSGVFPLERKGKGATKIRIPAGEPTGKERYKITMQAYGVAQTKVRKEFYDLYLEFYAEELDKSGLQKDKSRWAILTKVENLEAEVSRLKELLSKCSC